MPFQLRPYFPPVFSTPALENAPDAVFRPAPRDGVAPENFHAMSIFPEYFKIAGQWHLARESRMDCVAVWDRGRIDVREFRRLRQGELVAVGRTEQGEEGILVHPDGFRERRVARDVFAFRQGRSRETDFSRDYDELYELLRHERDHGKVVWVMGPAFAFDHDARNAFSRLIAGGFVHAVLAGNALATHDLEAAYLNTALGQNIYTQESQPNGHYNHLDTINRVRLHGSIPAFLKAEQIKNAAVITALSFATFENICYLIQNGAGHISFIFFRGIGTGAMHVICGAIVGGGLAYVWQRIWLKIAGTCGLLGAAITFHAIYNLLIAYGGAAQYIAYLLPVLILAAGKLIFRSSIQ